MEANNNQKMREALSDACYAMFNFLKTQYGGYEEMANALDKAKAALAEPPKPMVNNAKMREAIAKCVNLITEFGNAEIVKTPLDVIIDIEAILKAALSAPPRNCDVGTAEEQDKRFTRQFCRAGIEGCIRCKLNTLQHRGNTCGIHWSQMPYKEGDNNADE